jgi:hypothetical protein
MAALNLVQPLPGNAYQESQKNLPLLAVAGGRSGKLAIQVLEMVTVGTILRIELPYWDDFRAASAGHRLIEYGYQIDSPAFMLPGNAAGWTPYRTGYVAPVHIIHPGKEKYGTIILCGTPDEEHQNRFPDFTEEQQAFIDELDAAHTSRDHP